MDFSDLGKMKEMMGQAKQMQEQMEKKLAETVVEASTGGGVVTVRMNGKKEVLRGELCGRSGVAGGPDCGGGE
jgi:DNA-binding protein YbaB